MPFPSKPPPLSEALAYAARAREHLRAGLGDARNASLTPPPADEHARRFFFGFALPLTLMRVAWANAEIRRSIVRRLIPPLLLVGLVLTVGIVDIVHDVAASRRNPAALAEKAREDEDKDDETGADEQDEDDKAASRAQGEAIEKALEQAKARGESPLQISKDVFEASRAGAEAEGALREAAKKAKEEARRAGSSHVAAKPASSSGLEALEAIWAFLTSKVAKLIATLSVIEWILVWIGREHHDQIAWETAVLTGVPGEALAAPPRLRFDIGWLKLKAWRAIRLLIFFALAVPLAWVLGMIPVVGGPVGVGVEALWAAYWACVFAIANTAQVWEAPVAPGAAPWFMRALDAAGRIPIAGLPFRLQVRLMARVTGGVWPACLAFEQAPWESAGLALARTLASLPPAYIITRPIFAPAATHAYLSRVVGTQAGEAGSNASVTP